MGSEILTVFDPESAKAIQAAAEFGTKAVDASTGLGRYAADPRQPAARYSRHCW